ncbi:MAG: ParB/RepB/Spo0J family partition protein [Spirochaetales bacterium]|nr:ParB/RepB/Spo0J family partition protein [Spirochaetales bacterium]
MSNKPALGKGLDALFGGDNQNAQVSETENLNEKIDSTGSGLRFVAIGKLDANSNQPRKTFSDEALGELADSIREQGILQPILVEAAGSRYRIIAGERRFRASQLAGITEVPVIIKNLTEAERLEVALIENIQREDLNPMEEAIAYKAIMDAGQLSQEEVATKVGKKRPTVANSLRLLRLEKDMQNSVAEGDLSPGHARSILSLENPADRRILFSRILNGGMSVREAEKMAGELSRGQRKSPARKEAPLRTQTPELREIEQRFIDVFGTKVKIKGSNNKGQIEISYLSMDDLERIVDIIG